MTAPAAILDIDGTLLDSNGDAVRAAEKVLYLELIDEVEPLTGARELLEGFKRHDVRVVLASSAKPEEIERYLDLLDARGLADAWTSAGDVDRTKPRRGRVRGVRLPGGAASAVVGHCVGG